MKSNSGPPYSPSLTTHYTILLTAAWSPDGLGVPGVLAHRGGRPAAHEAAPGEEGEAGGGDLQAGPGRADPLLAVLHTWGHHIRAEQGTVTQFT